MFYSWQYYTLRLKYQIIFNHYLLIQTKMLSGFKLLKGQAGLFHQKIKKSASTEILGLFLFFSFHNWELWFF